MPQTRIDGHVIELSNQDKVLFPKDGITKGDLIAYYRQIAPRMLPFLRDRPLALHRYPDGIDEEGFVQQQAPDYFPDWVERAAVAKEGGRITHAVCNSEATLAYLANQGVVTPHVWLSRMQKPRHPDRLIFDLDPPGQNTGAGFDAVRRAAADLHTILDAVGLPAYVMTTGSSGLHVVTPLDASVEFDAVRAFARSVAEMVVAARPDELTVEQRKNKRRGRVFVDTLRNAYGQTAVPPYAVRARPGAPVATPVTWDEVARRGLHPRRYTVGNIFRRLGQKDDPWSGIEGRAADLAGAARHLKGVRV